MTVASKVITLQWWVCIVWQFSCNCWESRWLCECVCVRLPVNVCVHCAFNAFVLTLLRMPVSFSFLAGNAVDAAESNQCVRKQLEQTSLLISRHWKMCKASHQEAVVIPFFFFIIISKCWAFFTPNMMLQYGSCLICWSRCNTSCSNAASLPPTPYDPPTHRAFYLALSAVHIFIDFPGEFPLIV